MKSNSYVRDFFDSALLIKYTWSIVDLIMKVCSVSAVWRQFCPVLWKRKKNNLDETGSIHLNIHNHREPQRCISVAMGKVWGHSLSKTRKIKSISHWHSAHQNQIQPNLGRTLLSCFSNIQTLLGTSTGWLAQSLKITCVFYPQRKKTPHLYYWSKVKWRSYSFIFSWSSSAASLEAKPTVSTFTPSIFLLLRMSAVSLCRTQLSSLRRPSLWLRWILKSWHQTTGLCQNWMRRGRTSQRGPTSWLSYPTL